LEKQTKAYITNEPKSFAELQKRLLPRKEKLATAKVKDEAFDAKKRRKLNFCSEFRDIIREKDLLHPIISLLLLVKALKMLSLIWNILIPVETKI
jgi:hypothetical protein